MVIGGLHFITLNSHRLFGIATVRFALEVYVLDPVVCLKVFLFSLMLVMSFIYIFIYLVYLIADFV